MINIDFSVAVASFIFIFLNTILVIWIFNKRQKDKDLTLDPKHIWYCSVCSYTYINTREDLISICPRCSSYNKKVLT